MRLGFVGLGQMGRHMARRLTEKSGGSMAVYDVSPAACDGFREIGARTLARVEEIAGCDIVFLSLPDTKIVEQTVERIGGDLQSGQVIVDLSTIGYLATLELARRLGERGVAFLDAPVSGMEARARDGTLTVMCGGDAAVFERVRPYLAHIGNQIFHMGAVGSGQLAKLINQLLFDINAAALAEILPMAARLGLDCEKTGAIVNSGTGRSYASEFFIPRILTRDFSQGYPLAHAYKDLISAAELSANRTFPLPVLHAAAATYQQALLEGFGKEDKGAMIKVYERLLGVEFRAGRQGE
ncbi:MAG: NAD(P)-dependent oxidoreductase [Candidatus Accumulibacter sp.]|jgi:3-hydroxyisobutyrate dehydrogenase-like beta-hydroxyacid dehydrogenase|nr:NAD(P)-dependent oxidoreductase [Accumulibacter sp.]